MRLRRLLVGPLLAGLVACPSTCGGSTSKPSSEAGASGPASSAPVILVTNDDGVSAPGIDTVVSRLRTLPNARIEVVAPATNQSGTGGRTTAGTLPRHAASTAGGYPATAVDGYPADTIRVALDDLGLRPALVVSGINRGQNVGPIAAISGTVGAARAAAERGVPAIAASSGTPAAGGAYDYVTAAGYVLQEVQRELATAPGTGTVANLNVPSCSTGHVRGLQEPPPETAPDPRALATSTCTSTTPPSTEIESFSNGFAVLTRIPARADQ